MAIGTIANLVTLIREINLQAIKKEAEQRFALLIVGEGTYARLLAERLGVSPGKRGIHPWIVVHSLPLPEEQHNLSHYVLAIIVSVEVELGQGEQSALRRLHETKVPVVTVVVGESALTQVGAEVPREHEAARVLLLPSLEEQALQPQLAPAMLRAAPEELRLALARQLPLLREPLVYELIEETSRANALYSASTGLAEVIPVLTIPLNAADIVVLTKNQLVMAFKIALASGQQGGAREIMGKIVGVLGGGFLFRQLARELVGLIPVVGIVPKVAVSYAGTWVIGRTIYLWAAEGQRLNRKEIRRFYDEAVARGRALAETLVNKVRAATPLLPAPGHGSAETPPPEAKQKASLWQRLRGRQPF
ncbi:MAG: hypothetical protein ACRDIB_14575 [Ardenticatenaceae bacterium]